MQTRPGIERLTVAVVVSGCGGMAVCVGLTGLGLGFTVAASIAFLLAVAGVLWSSRRLPASLDGIRTRKPLLSAAWLLLGLVALVQTARMSAFMADPAQPRYSLMPWDDWLVQHCCLTAYSESARLSGEGETNIYNAPLYGNRKLVGFNVDAYHYPPPFLLLPLVVRVATGGDFVAVRALWFGASALALILAIGLVTLRLEPEGQLRAIGMAPLIWCSMPVLSGLQMSNVQILIVSISVITLVLLPRKTPAGGLLLAMGAVGKIFPGILFVYLLARRKWREAAWIAGFAVALTIVAFFVVGPAPFRAFIVYELPRLSSGEAFARPLTRVFAVARNMAPFGIPLKLAWLGVPGMTMDVGRVVSMIYVLGVVGLAIWSGRRQPRSSTEAISVWLSLLSLGTLASPFAPANYVLVSLVWLVCINRDLFTPAVAIAVWLTISVPFFIPREAPFLLQAICYFPAQALALGVPSVILWSAGTEHAYEEAPETRSVPALA